MGRQARLAWPTVISLRNRSLVSSTRRQVMVAGSMSSRQKARRSSCSGRGNEGAVRGL